MERQKEETKMSVKDLSSEELRNTFGGAWLEVRAINGDLWFIFHWDN
jgi:hypothetical protein